MSLSSAQLDAFSELAKTSSFSKAAKNLFVTQSALSQRVSNLEEALGTALLVREVSGIRLTAAGEQLLQYCRNRRLLESECLARIKTPKQTSLSGVIRVGGFSTIMRSIVLPSLHPLLTKNQDLRIETLTKEMRELPQLLRSGETDYIFTDHILEKDGVESILIGYEEYNLIESRTSKTESDVFLDHDSDDNTTLRFLELQGKKTKKITRSFLDEIYAIIDSVALGFGKAVVPMHLIQTDKRVQVVRGYKTLKLPVYLSHYRQPFTTQLQKLTVECLVDGAKKCLSV